MEAYLDNAATTRCYDSVREIVVKTMMEDYGNPSSMHRKGVEAEQYMREARQKIARTIKAAEQEIYFTSGGTESNNWALMGAALAKKRQGRHIITTQIEHAAVAAPLAFLEEQGFRITRLRPDREGRIDLEELEEAVTDDTILASVMYVNNEIGAVQDIAAVSERLKRKNPGSYLHVDAIQAYGKYRILPKRLGIDLLSVSGHKIHGPKGTGFLYIGDKVRIHPLILGGGQQGGMRSGTDNVPGAAGLGEAAARIYENLEENSAHMAELRRYLTEELSRMPDVVLHGMDGGQGAPHIVSASFLGVRSEVLLHTLEDRQIYVSAGSACSSHKRAGSATLTAIGCSQAERESAVRFSFSEQTTREELDYTLEVLGQALPMLRRFTRR